MSQYGLSERADPTADFVASLGYIALGSRLRRLSDRFMNDVATIYRSRGIAFEPRFFPLFRLLAERGSIAVSDAAKALGMTHSAVSQTTRLMSEHQIITSTVDPDDERRRLLKLTVVGEQMMPALQAAWKDIEESIGSAISECGVEILTALDAIEQALDRRGLVSRAHALHRSRFLSHVDVVDFDDTYADDFKELNLEWLEPLFALEPEDHRLLDDPRGQIINKGGHVLFAVLRVPDAPDEVVGTCALLLEGRRFELGKMAVRKTHQGRGVGNMLLDAAIETARRAGAEAIDLLTSSKLRPALSLYRKAGFRLARSGPHPKYDRVDLVMTLELDALGVTRPRR